MNCGKVAVICTDAQYTYTKQCTQNDAINQADTWMQRMHAACHGIPWPYTALRDPKDTRRIDCCSSLRCEPHASMDATCMWHVRWPMTASSNRKESKSLRKGCLCFTLRTLRYIVARTLSLLEWTALPRCCEMIGCAACAIAEVTPALHRAVRTCATLQ